MLGIDAARVHTKVVDRLACYKRTTVEFVRESVCPNLAPLVGAHSHIEESIPIGMECPGPFPAVGSISDLRLETLHVRDCARSVWHEADYTTAYTQFIGEQLLAQLAVTR